MSAYSKISKKLTDDECVILDGAIATELQKNQAKGFELSDDLHWGFDALYNTPETVLDVHSSYIGAGADIITTNTYSILDAPQYTGNFDIHEPNPVHWMDMTRTAIELPRQAIKAASKENEISVAFSIGGDIETEDHQETVSLLMRLFEEMPPDLIIFETVSLVEDNHTIGTVQKLIDFGLPVWVSFRRCRKGVCGIHGQLWGGPEGDRFGRLARQLEKIGTEALLINCLPTRRVKGTLPWLRDFTDLPLGVYPNFGRYTETGWDFDENLTPQDFSELAIEWRQEGAQIIGGCCGIGPDEISQAAKDLEGVARQSPSSSKFSDMDRNEKIGEHPLTFWRDSQDRNVFPLPLPKISVDKGVFVPTQGSYLIWKTLFNTGLGKDKRCLDIGCGCGILTLQLALNGAESVTAIDIMQASVDNTMTNAFRNGVEDQVIGQQADLYSFAPEEPFDVIVASLYQMPTNPKGQFSQHRDIDYWGRNLIDHFLLNLPNLLKDDGTAYLMQVSMIGAQRTQQLLERNDYTCRVIDFNPYQFNQVFSDNLDQIKMVESLSDAYHFNFDENENVMVMYLLEITRES